MSLTTALFFSGCGNTQPEIGKNQNLITLKKSRALNENTINLGVFNPAGVERLLDYPELDVCIIEIAADDKTRLLRQLNREQNPDVHEIVRRFGTDEEDFDDFHREVVDNRYTIMNNTNETITVVNNLILCIQEHFKEA